MLTLNHIGHMSINEHVDMNGVDHLAHLEEMVQINLRYKYVI